MDRHIVSSKSLEWSQPATQRSARTKDPPFAIEHVVQHIMPDLARLSTYYPTMPMRLRKDRTRQEPVPICRRKNRRWHHTAKDKSLASYC